MGELETKIKKPSFFKKLGFLALNILLLTTFYNVRAADGISAQIVADPAQAAVGDVVSLTVQVNHPAGYRTVPVQLISEQSSEYGAWGPFEVRGQYPLETIQDSAGGEISRQIIEVTLWETGIFTTPELPLAVIDTAGSVAEIFAAPTQVEVVSLLVEGDTALRDIKPQATLPIPPLWPWIVALLLLAALLFLLGRWFYGRRADQPTESIEPVDLRPAHQIALADLADIEAQNLPQQSRFKEHYSQVTDVLRTYLEERYSVPALGGTTLEIRHALRSIADRAGFQSRALNLLDEADLVKFAKVTPTVGDAQELLNGTRQIVLDTIPAEATQHEPEES